MLPSWLIKKINKQEHKEKFQQEFLYVEESTQEYKEKPKQKEEIVERGYTEIDI